MGYFLKICTNIGHIFIGRITVYFNPFLCHKLWGELRAVFITNLWQILMQKFRGKSIPFSVENLS